MKAKHRKRNIRKPLVLTTGTLAGIAGALAFAPNMVSAGVSDQAKAADTPDPQVSATDSLTVNVVNGGLSIRKTSNRATILKGQPVTFNYAVTASGIPFSGVRVTDNKCSPVTGPTGDNGDGILQPGETWLYSCTQNLSQTTTNIGTVTGTPILGATPSPTATPTPTPTATATGTLRDGTYTGASQTVNVPQATNDIFQVQVQIVVAGGQIQSVTMPVMTATNRTSVLLSQDAAITLSQEAITAQSANIAQVSGATYTSVGYINSLQDALTQAGG